MTTDLCECGKPRTHLHAPVDSRDWACLVPDFDPATGVRIPATPGVTTLPTVEQREALVLAIDKLHEEASVGGHPNEANAAERLAVVLGWEGDPGDGPFADWMQARLREVLR